MSAPEHISVLLEEAVAAMQLERGSLFVDGTFGRGGHTRKILQAMPAQAQLIAVDRDPEAAAVAEALCLKDSRINFFRRNFSELKTILDEQGLLGQVDGLLLDLGVSSPQLDDAARGFSFRNDGPLDMRMDPDTGESAAQWLAHVDETELANVIYKYGDERLSRRIARRIVEARVNAPLETTAQLASLVATVVRRNDGKHPATRTFQAIRIAVNGELDALDTVLQDAWDMLSADGRLVIVSFHSLEDRLVKQFFRGDEANKRPRRLPLPSGLEQNRWRASRKAVKASEAELAHNPRARSAVMRVAEKQPL
ncbi:ribosomal RNA small subunit methyltransferase H [Oratosquilla oratoria]|uniref:ribosomal RNA small subunit methyltransferase H n=1 Tax=Oratosquilla oratoria TaxID=337810 RepID=UPI003F777641